MKQKAQSKDAFLRCFHGVPKSMSIDIYLDDVLYIKDMLYEDFSDYLPLSQGKHTLSIKAHHTDTVLCSREVLISKSHIYTLVIAPHQKNSTFNLYLINDTTRSIKKEYCMVRIGSFCALEDFWKVSVLENTLAFKKIAPHQLTHYLTFKPANYTLKLQGLDNSTLNYESPSFLLKPSRFYTFYLVGGQKPAFPLKSVLSIDGNSFLSF